MASRAEQLTMTAVKWSGWAALIGGLAGWGVSAAGGQTNSLFLRGYQESMTGEQRAAQERATQRTRDRNRPMALADQVAQVQTRSAPVLQASWITVAEPSPKDYRVHDLVTIVVHEVSKHSTKADTKTERDYSVQAALKDWFRFTRGGIRASQKKNGEPKFDLSFEKNFEGKGEAVRSDMLTARIQAEVIDVMPNGNLVLEAVHSVRTDREVTMITLTGVCRSRDVGVDNTVLSTQLARLDVEKTHSGPAEDATRPGLLSGLLDWINPF